MKGSIEDSGSGKKRTMQRFAIGVAAVLAASVVGCDRQQATDTNEANEGIATQDQVGTETREGLAAEDDVREGEAARRPDDTAFEGEKQPVAGRASEDDEAAQDSQQLLREASEMVTTMKSEDKLKRLLTRSKGIFLVPNYGRGAVGIGARGGEGVLLVKRGGQWSGPAFYNLGGISVGAQFGAEGGEIAMLLMSDKAVSAFKEENGFSMNADAKLTMVDYSAMAEASANKGDDAVLWSSTAGAFAGVALGVTDISWDEEENAAFYSKGATPQAFIRGDLRAPSVALQQMLSSM